MRNFTFLTRMDSIISIIVLTLGSGCYNNDQVAFRGGPQMRALTEKESADLSRIASQEFSAGIIHDSHIDIDTGFRNIEQTFSLHEASKTVETIKQSERRLSNVLFTQGFDGWPMSQKFNVREKGKLDLLVVIDNSGSMAEIQRKLARNMAPLLKHVANTNWQIAVVTTSSSCLTTTSTGKRSITRADYDKDPIATENMFKELIQVGDNGKTTELGILYAAEGITGNCGDAKDDWKREGSQKAVLIVSDEKNCGSAPNEGCPGEAYAKADFFIGKAPAKTQVHGLFLLADNYDVCPDSGGYENEYPAEYIRLVQMTGGKYGEICQEDYSAILEEISAGIDHDTIQKFELDYVPSAQGIKVTLDGKELTGGYAIEDRFVVMTTPISQSSQTIEFSYRHDDVPRTDKYTLPSAPDPQTLRIIMNGSLVLRQNYSFDEATNTLQMKTMPPDMANIMVEYRENVPLPDQFPLEVSKEILENSIKIQIDGRDCDDVVFDQLKGQLIFKAAPTDGSVITLSYSRLQDKVTNYKLEGIAPANIESATFTDAETKAPIPAKIAEGTIVVPESEVYEGRLVIAHYDPLFKGSDLDFVVPLANAPIDGTLQVTDNSGEKEICGKDLQIDQNNQVTFSCLKDDMTTIGVDYAYLTDFTNVFKFEGAVLRDASWQVKVDGNEITDYEMEDQTFTIPVDQLTAGSKVVIVRTPKGLVNP